MNDKEILVKIRRLDAGYGVYRVPADIYRLPNVEIYTLWLSLKGMNGIYPSPLEWSNSHNAMKRLAIIRKHPIRFHQHNLTRYLAMAKK